MATIKVNGTSYFISSSKITTPSIKINGQGYIPLFSGNKNSTVDYNRYRYTLGGLKVGNYRAAVSRSFINSAPTATLSASATRVANGTNVTLTTTAADPDGDTLTNFCYYTKVNGTWDNGGNSGSSITVSGSNTTKEYYVVVTDPYGASVTSNHVTVEWYNPNNAPTISLTNVPSTSSNGSISFTILCHDQDNDDCTLEYGYVYIDWSAGGGTRYYPTGYTGVYNTASLQITDVTVNAALYNAAASYQRVYEVYAKVTDSHGESAITTATVYYTDPTPTYAYKCTVECWKKEWQGGGYTSGLPVTWHVKVTALRYPSSCEGIYVFGKIGNGSGWIYKSDEIDFYYNYKPATIDLTPYVSFDNTFEVWTYAGYKTVTETDQKAAGTVNTVAVSFPDKAGESHKNTYTFEWN